MLSLRKYAGPHEKVKMAIQNGGQPNFYKVSSMRKKNDDTQY